MIASRQARKNRIAWQYATAMLMLFGFGTSGALAQAQKPDLPLVVATPVGPEQVIFEGPKQGCDPIDIPDVPLRAYRLAEGGIAVFGLHHENRRLSGPSLSALKIECPVVFAGKGNPDPAKLDDRIWIAATHSPDGKMVHAVGHAEYHGESHPGRCPFKDNAKCLWVSMIGLRSNDGGKSFSRLNAPVGVPGLKAEAEQGRHRGFFNPTNIITHQGAHYFIVAQTGWAAQPYGACLFRTQDIASGIWRAWDGKGFNVAFPSPYNADFKPQGACAPLAPFHLVPGSLTKHRASGLWLALFPANKGNPDRRGGTFPASGFYLAASRDLVSWSDPQLVMPTPILGESPCGHPAIAAYPVLIDEAAQTRNFEDVGDVAQLAYTRITASSCSLVHERQIVMRRVRITHVKAH